MYTSSSPTTSTSSTTSTARLIFFENQVCSECAPIVIQRKRERERRVFGGLASLAAYGASGSGRRLKHVRVAIRQAVYDRVNADTADATIDLDVRLVLPVLQPLY